MCRAGMLRLPSVSKHTLLVPPKSPAQWQIHKGSESCQTVLANPHKHLGQGSTAYVKCFSIERCCFIYILHNPFIKRRPFNVGTVRIVLHKSGSFGWQPEFNRLLLNSRLFYPSRFFFFLFNDSPCDRVLGPDVAGERPRGIRTDKIKTGKSF